MMYTVPSVSIPRYTLGLKQRVIHLVVPRQSRRAQRLRQQRNAQHKRSRRGHAFQKTAPAYILNCAHASSFAADLIAARTRW